MQSKFFVTAALVASVFAGGGCSSEGSKPKSINHKATGLATGTDSLAYIVGMNIAEQLQKMDSTINVDVVCRAIIEQSEGDALFSRDQARESYLRYLLYTEPEQRRGYEERFLADLALNDRSYTRTRSGLTYNIEVIGDESIIAKSNNDWVTLKYSIERVGGESVAKDITISEALSDLPNGVEESVKMIGKGGRIRSWIPSKLAYGEAGDEELGVEPIETLLFDIEIVDVDKNSALRHKRELEKEF